MARSDETLDEVVHFLFGDGAYEVFSKSTKAEREKRQAQVGLASNILGITAGAQGLYAAEQDFKSKRRELKGESAHRAEGRFGKLRPVKAVKNWASKPKNALYVAGGAVGLQAANLAGDAVANRVLAREAKEPVKKMNPDGADLMTSAAAKDPRKKLIDPKKQGLSLPMGGQLMRLAANDGPKAAKVTTGGAKAVAAQTQTGYRAIQARKQQVTKRFTADDMAVTTEISKTDTDKRQIFGWASVVEKNGVPVVDLQGDYISVEEVEKAAYEYVQKSRKGGNQHQRDGEAPVHVSDMIESFVVTPEKKEKLGLPDDLPTGWWVGFQVHDDDTWAQIKDGKRPQLSIHGRGKRKEL